MDALATASVPAPRGAFLVTQECISTPLIPIFLAAVLVYSRTWWATALWVAASVPLFLGLGIARLLVVALPAGLATSPAFFIHAFFQLLIAACMVCGLAFWRYGARVATFVRVGAALALAIAFVRWLGVPYTDAIFWFRTATAFDDSQGALMFLPAFQVGLFLALWVAAFVSSGWTRFLCGASLSRRRIRSPSVHCSMSSVSSLVRDIRARRFKFDAGHCDSGERYLASRC